MGSPLSPCDAHVTPLKRAVGSLVLCFLTCWNLRLPSCCSGYFSILFKQVPHSCPQLFPSLHPFSSLLEVEFPGQDLSGTHPFLFPLGPLVTTMSESSTTFHQSALISGPLALGSWKSFLQILRCLRTLSSSQISPFSTGLHKWLHGSKSGQKLCQSPLGSFFEMTHPGVPPHCAFATG